LKIRKPQMVSLKNTTTLMYKIKESTLYMSPNHWMEGVAPLKYSGIATRKANTLIAIGDINFV